MIFSWKAFATRSTCCHRAATVKDNTPPVRMILGNDDAHRRGHRCTMIRGPMFIFPRGNKHFQPINRTSRGIPVACARARARAFASRLEHRHQPSERATLVNVIYCKRRDESVPCYPRVRSFGGNPEAKTGANARDKTRREEKKNNNPDEHS